MDQDQITQLLDLYLDGKTTLQQDQLVEDWLETRVREKDEWGQMDTFEQQQYLDVLFTELQGNIRQDREHLVATMPRRRWSVLSFPAAAAILLIAFAGYLLWPLFQQQLSSSQLTTVKIAEKEQKQFTLADGSKVWVNGGSTLRFPESFGETREVFLTGEAFFDVAHDAEKPFIIHTGKVSTTVLGTAFNIKADPIGHTVAVTVARGKVSVKEGERLLGILTKNQQVSFNTLTSRAVRSQVDSEVVSAWYRNDLYFDEITFEQAVLRLKERFGVKIDFSNEGLKHCRFSGTILQEQELENILNTICAFNQASYQKQKGNRYLILGQGCQN